jgi:acetyl-CoA acetyltransferase
MATDTVDGRASHIRGLTVTTLASLAGLLAAVGSAVVTAGSASPATDQTGLIVLVAAIVVQFPILQALGSVGLVAVDVEDFGVKDYLYVLFMTFSLWFVGWTVLLTTGTTF